MSNLSDAIGGEYEYDGSAQSYSALPPGWYDAMAVKAEVKDTKDGTGKYLKVQFQIIAGQYEKRMVFANYNVRNRSPQAQEIGLRQLGQLWEAAGLGRIIRDENDLLNKAVCIKVTTKKDNPDDNDVSGARPCGEPVAAVPPAPAPAKVPPPWPPAQPAAAPTTTAGKKMPWQK